MDIFLHPALLGAVVIAAVIVVWKCRPWIRIVAVIVCAVVAALAILASFKFGQDIAYTRFDSDVCRPTGTIILDLKQTADSGDADLVQKKLGLFATRWMELIDKKATPELFVDEITGLTKTNETANQALERTSQ